MHGNRVKETSASTGAGNLTLAGAATGFQTFNTVFNTDRPFHYFILHDTDDSWEQGIGHLSASATLVRDHFLDSSTGSVITFAAGGLTVIASPSAGSLYNGSIAFNHTAGVGQILRAEGHIFSATTTSAQTVDRLIAVRFNTLVGLQVDQMVMECTSAVALAETKAALYRLDQNGDARYRIASCITNTFDCATTGIKIASLDEGSIFIPPGDYVMMMVSNSTQTLRVLNVSSYDAAHFGGRTSSSLVIMRSCFAAGHAFSTALPEPVGVTWGSNSSIHQPYILLEHS